ncbi:MAG: hypothetical protein QF652_04775 [Dehalococcoidia bacterium]|nr:hypothetical protein [Dehalococcoidia bacterium]
MQNRYVGDVGDFGTYGLLRAVVGAQPGAIGTRLRLGVHWCLVPDETHNDDGKHIDYLARSKENLTRFRVCDPQLFDRLGAVLSRGRKVANVEQGDVLPADTRYFNRPLSFQDLHGRPSREARLSRRAEWSEAAVRELRQCEVVFLDPDNGLEGQTARHALSGPSTSITTSCERSPNLAGASWCITTSIERNRLSIRSAREPRNSRGH